MTQTKELQLSYWNDFKVYLKNTNSTLESGNAHSRYWHAIFIGINNAYFELTISKGTNRVELRLNGINAKENFRLLKKYELQAEKILGKLIWDEQPNNKLSKIYLIYAANLSDKNKWEEQFKWLKNNLEDMKKFFEPIIKRDLIP